MEEPLDFISNRFDENEKDRKGKEGIIKHLKGCFIYKSKRVDSLSGQVEKQEQYSRRNCLLLGVVAYYYLLHAIRENRNEKTDVCVLLREKKTLNY